MVSRPTCGPWNESARSSPGPRGWSCRGRLLTGRLGWSLQRPGRRAVERDEPEIARWIAHEWPRIKGAGDTRAWIVFLDEPGVFPFPSDPPHLRAPRADSATAAPCRMRDRRGEEPHRFSISERPITNAGSILSSQELSVANAI
ncbi:winged helix-turn-helix domain-containing protein [Streptomyces spirodelae]|uniref:Winged helix-turn-helix domain-containing protein n=1 Tax=Streptomyces spirodelae TaxID=2812904 RepID=A0ABS3WQ95_9ACTN|nr:winged helix-turn-helix domain-containing protein [Streptomyces spirodelae]